MSVQHREHTAVMSTANKAVSRTELKMYERILSRRSAPKLLAMGIPKPMQMPMQKPSTRNCTLLVAPTAASAPVPSTRPTMAASTRLYICCKRLPNKSGTANCRISLRGLPSVILFVTKITRKYIVSFQPSYFIIPFLFWLWQNCGFYTLFSTLFA